MARKIYSTLLAGLFAAVALNAHAVKSPDCTGVDRWPASMAFAQLKNAGIVTADSLDLSKTRVNRLASEQIQPDLFVQIHRITFIQKSGKLIEVITSNQASSEECSMGSVDVFVVDKHLGDPSAEQH